MNAGPATTVAALLRHLLYHELMGSNCGRATLVFVAAGVGTGWVSAGVGSDKSHDARLGHQELLRQQKLARREGVPLTESQLRPHASRGAAQNAGPLYTKAVALFREIIKNDTHTWSKFDPYGSDNTASLAADRRIVALAEPSLELIARAGRLRYCDLGIRPSQVGFDLKFPLLAGLKLLTRVAVAQSELLAHDGRPTQALKRLAGCAPICGHLAQSPGSIEALAQCAMDATFTREIAKILSHHGREPGVAAAALRCIGALGPLPDLVQVAESENLTQLVFLGPKFMTRNSSSTGAAANPKDAAFNKLAERPGMVDRWKATEIGSTRKFVSLFRAAGDNWLALEHRASALGRDLAKPRDEAHAWQAEAGFPDFTGIIDQIALRLSNRRVLTEAATILDAAKLPAALPVRGSTAKDPLAAGSLHYERTAEGFKVYGVGAKGVDHGGKPSGPSLTNAQHDVVFTYALRR